jgi:RNA polymerase sigma-70 factor (ECF subfamily)
MTKEAIESLYRKYGAMVLRRARALLGDDQLAKDAMQEVFIRALRAGSGFRGEASPSTWLYRVTTNYCLNAIRDGKRRRVLDQANLPAPGADPRSAEAQVIVAEIMARVPEALREIAVYYYVDQLNQEEIALLLGVSRRTIGNRLDEFRVAVGDLLALQKVAS